MMKNSESEVFNNGPQYERLTLSDDVAVPSQSVLSFSRPQEKQGNYFETNTYPEVMHSFSWATMHDERHRLVTFRNFPSDSPISTIRLASKGFIYIDNVAGHIMTIICFFCNTQLDINNENVDNIDDEHRRLAADCPMLNGTHCTNTPLSHQCATQNIGHILPQFARGQYGSQSDLPNASTVCHAKTPDIVRTSQPSERASSHDEAVSGSFPRNYNCTHSNQTSQLMSDSPSTPQHDLTVTSQTIFNGAQVGTATTTTKNGSAENDSEVNNPGLPQNSSQQEQTNFPQDTTSDNADVTPSHESLGIITARAKYIHNATKQARFDTFEGWPKEHHIHTDDLIKCGFFYQGRGDCVRCFYCGIGLRNWELGDDVWVEHAYWSPRCAFLLQVIGRDFVNTVQSHIKETDEQISFGDVAQKMKESGLPAPFEIGKGDIARNPAVLALTSHGFDKNKILHLAKDMLERGESLSSGMLYEAAIKRNIPKSGNDADSSSDFISYARRIEDNEQLTEMVENICLENHENHQLTKCKVCLDNEVAVVFLPCGHLVTCTECAGALTRCPVCRVAIKAIVMAHLA